MGELELNQSDSSMKKTIRSELLRRVLLSPGHARPVWILWRLLTQEASQACDYAEGNPAEAGNRYA